MPSPRDLRRRIRSIGGTAQITKAMQMVAASKMRKAQQAAVTSAPFARRLYRMQRTATTRVVDFKHPLLNVRPVDSAIARKSKLPETAGGTVILKFRMVFSPGRVNSSRRESLSTLNPDGTESFTSPAVLERA